MRERRHWGAFIEQFQTAITEAQVTCLDLPGNGELNAQTSPMRVQDMAEWCRQELRCRGIEPPYAVLAMSLGAMVTVAWAQAHPEELRGMVLINTSLRPFSRLHQRLRPHAWPLALRLATGRLDDREVESGILELTSRDRERTQAVLPDWVRWRQQRPVSAINALRQLWAAARFRAPTVAPPVPTLVLNGAQDQLVSPACSQALAEAWGVPLRVHATAGHDLPLDDGRWLAEQVRQFWQSHGGR